jgi:hypothetical protein
MTGGDPEPHRRAEVEHVQAEPVQVRGHGEGVDHVGEPVKGRGSGERGRLSEPRVVGRDHVAAARKPSHQLFVLGRRTREAV